MQNHEPKKKLIGYDCVGKVRSAALTYIVQVKNPQRPEQLQKKVVMLLKRWGLWNALQSIFIQYMLQVTTINWVMGAFLRSDMLGGGVVSGLIRGGDRKQFSLIWPHLARGKPAFPDYKHLQGDKND